MAVAIESCCPKADPGRRSSCGFHCALNSSCLTLFGLKISGIFLSRNTVLILECGSQSTQSSARHYPSLSLAPPNCATFCTVAEAARYLGWFDEFGHHFGGNERAAMLKVNPGTRLPHNLTVNVWHRCTLQCHGLTSPAALFGLLMAAPLAAFFFFVDFMKGLAITLAIKGLETLNTYRLLKSPVCGCFRGGCANLEELLEKTGV